MFPEMMTAAIGLGMSAFGAVGAASSAQQISGIQQKKFADQEQQDVIRQNAMNINTRRNQMEVLRNNQRSRSLALNNATSQGAQFGSGLQGGYGGIQGQSGNNLLNMDQNYQLNTNMFAVQGDINKQDIALSQAQSSQATSNAIGGFGKSVLGLMGPVGNLFGSGPSNSSGGGSSGGTYSSMTQAGFGGLY